MSTARTDALRTGATVDARVAAAYRDGEATAADRGPRVPPWPPGSALLVERLLGRAWCRGYTAGHGFADLID